MVAVNLHLNGGSAPLLLAFHDAPSGFGGANGIQIANGDDLGHGFRQDIVQVGEPHPTWLGWRTSMRLLGGFRANSDPVGIR